MSSRVHEARLVRREVIADSTVEFVLRTAEELTFRPGQFISVNVGQDERGDAILRSYSIASPPWRRGELALVLRMIEGGAGSAFFGRLREGQPVRFTGPMGYFVNELAHPGDVVYVATGTGIAPLYPMALEALSRPETGRVLLHWGVRHEEDRFWLRELSALRDGPGRKAEVQIHLSQPRTAGPASWSGLRGRVVGPVLDELPRLRAPTFYLCGNGAMIAEVKASLQARGVDRKRQIRTEAFFDSA